LDYHTCRPIAKAFFAVMDGEAHGAPFEKYFRQFHQKPRPENFPCYFPRMVRLVLFDIDGTLVHTGHAGTQAFAKTFATEFKAADGLAKINFAGRTDVSLVREFFSYNQIPATPENFSRFFERYVFWLDHILAQSHRVLGKRLRGEEIVVIGDTPFDIRCGRAIGAKVLAVATGGAKLDELKKHKPDWAVEDLTKISAREICSR
jgi:phosphoglycolate phosphatase-like HAD superfamily hydrolase